MLQYESERNERPDLSTEDKIGALKALAQRRREAAAGTREDGYSRDYKDIEVFHDGFYDSHPWLSPWTVSACNVDSNLMVIGQDWASEDFLMKPPNARQRDLGHNPDLQTNKVMKRLLRDAFDRDFNDLFATNAFVFVKPGNMSRRIPRADLVRSSATYTLQEIRIVRPKIAICLGGATYNALRAALKHRYQPIKRANHEAPEVVFESTEIYGVPHVGAWGLNTSGGYPASLAIWQKLADRLARL